MWKLRLGLGWPPFFVDLPTFWLKTMHSFDADVFSWRGRTMHSPDADAFSWRGKTMHSPDADALSWREPTRGLWNKEKVILLTGTIFLFHYRLFGPRNLVWWCFTVTPKWVWRYMRTSNLISRHLEFFPKGLAYDFWSKSQISLTFVNDQIEPGNDVCWCFNVKSKKFSQNMNMSNLISRHLGFFPKG